MGILIRNLKNLRGGSNFLLAHSYILGCYGPDPEMKIQDLRFENLWKLPLTM